MLPFLKPKSQSGGVITSVRKPDGGEEKKQMEGEEDHAMIACAERLIRGMHAKDAKEVAAAFREAFECLELEPHEEIEHSSEEQASEE